MLALVRFEGTVGYARCVSWLSPIQPPGLVGLQWMDRAVSDLLKHADSVAQGRLAGNQVEPARCSVSGEGVVLVNRWAGSPTLLASPRALARLLEVGYRGNMSRD